MRIGGSLRDLVQSARSYGASLLAAGCLGRSEKLRKSGRAREALEVARRGLRALNAPIVRSQRGPEGSSLLMLTIQVEHLAQGFSEPGASPRDLAESCKFLKSLPEPLPGEVDPIKRDWLPYLEARLAAEQRDAADDTQHS